MRIRKGASRLLGAAYSCVPAPDSVPRFELPLPPPTPARHCTESHAEGGGFAADTDSGEPCCGLNRSPWDLIGELALSDPQEKELVETYLVHVACRASWLFPPSMPAASVKDEDNAEPWHRKVANKKTTAAKNTVVNEEDEKKDCNARNMKAKVKKEEGDGEADVEAWRCTKNNGKMWRCRQPVNRFDTLCDHHFQQKYPFRYSSESTSTAAASKPSTSSKVRTTKKKKSPDAAAGEEFYYYTGFGPYRTKRHCASSDQQQPLPPDKSEEKKESHAAPAVDQAQADATDHQVAGCVEQFSHAEDIAGIAGSDEESSDDGVSLGKSQQLKRWRKPVKARSLKSLM